MLAASSCDRAADAPTPASTTTSEKRIVTLLPFAADQLIEIGAPPVAVPMIRGGVPEAWDGIPTIALDHSAGPNLEQLIAADPDVVITTAVYAQFLPAIESSTGAEIVVMDVDRVEDVTTHITTLGEIAGRETEANELVESLQGRVPTNPGVGDPVRVLAVFGTPHAFYAFLPGSYLGDLVAHAGGELITGDMDSHSVFRGLAPISMEAVIDRDPEHLLVIFHGSEASARAMLERDALWGELSAVRNGAVTFLEDDLYAMRPGSELPRAIERIETIMDGARSERP